MPEDFLEILRIGLAELEIPFGNNTLEQYDLYKGELQKWSQVYNITALKDERDVAVRLFLDSLLYLKACPALEKRNISVLDVGSGGGFPGLVLKITKPDMEVTLLEPSGKRVSFLRHMIHKLKLPRVRVVRERVEDHAESAEGTYDIIISKALFRVKELITKTQMLTAPGSILLLSKGPAYVEEMAELKTGTADAYDNYRIQTTTLKLPQSRITRNFILVTV